MAVCNSLAPGLTCCLRVALDQRGDTQKLVVVFIFVRLLIIGAISSAPASPARWRPRWRKLAEIDEKSPRPRQMRSVRRLAGGLHTCYEHQAQIPAEFVNGRTSPEQASGLRLPLAAHCSCARGRCVADCESSHTRSLARSLARTHAQTT